MDRSGGVLRLHNGPAGGSEWRRLLPGLINAHDHLQLNSLPPLETPLNRFFTRPIQQPLVQGHRTPASKDSIGPPAQLDCRNPLLRITSTGQGSRAAAAN